MRAVHYLCSARSLAFEKLEPLDALVQLQDVLGKVLAQRRNVGRMLALESCTRMSASWKLRLSQAALLGRFSGTDISRNTLAAGVVAHAPSRGTGDQPACVTRC